MTARVDRSTILGRLGAGIAIAAGLLASATVGSIAQEAAPAAPPLPPNCVIVAEGLANPRDLAVGPDGTIYVTEAGAAGEEQITDPATGDVVTNRGTTGRVTAIAPDGTTRVVADGLSSYGVGFEVFGPTGIVATGTTLYVAVGGAGPASPLVTPLETENAVLAIDLATGEMTKVTDVNDYERTTNPDPHAVDSDVYGMAMTQDGALIVADAGGNTIYRVDPATGEFTVLAVVPGLPLQNAPESGNPARGGAAEIDPVPTAVEVGPDGTIYVGLLSGAPFPAGGAKVLRIDPDGTVSDYATGLTMIVGLAAGGDGSLYATQLSTDFLAQVPAPGSIVRIAPDGSQQIVVDGLVFPNGVTVGQDGELYVAVNSVTAPDAAPTGQVARCDPSQPGADTAASPTPALTETDENAGDVEADFTIVLTDLAYDVRELTIPANTAVTILLRNEGALPHDVTIDELGIQSLRLNSGESTTITIEAPTGEYTFYCSLPGHRAAGMVGTLKVQ